MKRLLITISIIAVVGIFSPGFFILAQPIHIPHEDPAMTKGALNGAALLRSYGNLFNLAAVRQYQGAQDMLDELNRAEIPDELRYIIDRYDSLCRQLFTDLGNAESLLNEASALLSNNQVSDAKPRLDDTEAAIQDARSRLEETEAATNTIGNKLGAFAVPATSQLRQAYDHLEQSLERLRQLINGLSQGQQSVAEKYASQAKDLIPTELTLTITPASVFVGDSITASGKLTSQGIPLPQRKLALLLNEKPLSVATGPDGSYAAKITIPCEYVSTMALYAMYIPSGDDISTYQASRSLPVAVNTRFYSTLLEILAPATASPGLPVTIGGEVSSTGGSADRTVKILLDNIQIAEETIRGKFSLEVTVPPQTPTGKHSLMVVVAPQGRYSGDSKSLSMNISKLPVQTDIQTPRLVIMAKGMQISGKVYHSLNPIQNAEVTLKFKNSSSTARTSADGTFSAYLDTPLDLSVIGSQQLAVTVEPVEPWYASLEVKRQIFTINPLNTALVLAGLISLGRLVYRRGRRRPARLQPGNVIPAPEVGELPVVTLTPETRYDFTGIKGRILSAYTSGLKAVQKATSIPVASHTTLREFLEIATPLLSTANRLFAELTTMAEIALYSVHTLDEDTATRGERLAASIKEELHNGAT